MKVLSYICPLLLITTMTWQGLVMAQVTAMQMPQVRQFAAPHELSGLSAVAKLERYYNKLKGEPSSHLTTTKKIRNVLSKSPSKTRVATSDERFTIYKSIIANVFYGDTLPYNLPTGGEGFQNHYNVINAVVAAAQSLKETGLFDSHIFGALDPLGNLDLLLHGDKTKGSAMFYEAYRVVQQDHPHIAYVSSTEETPQDKKLYKETNFWEATNTGNIEELEKILQSGYQPDEGDMIWRFLGSVVFAAV